MYKSRKVVLQKDPNLNVRLAEGDDAKAVADNVNASPSGPGYYKAIFGPFNVANLIDNSTLSLIGENLMAEENGPVSEFRGFVALDDNVSCLGDSQRFEPVLNVIKNYLSVNVSISFLFILFYLISFMKTGIQHSVCQLLAHGRENSYRVHFTS
jgi:hypothetical protein